jgi:hypothetical protein
MAAATIACDPRDATGLSRWRFAMAATTIAFDSPDATGLPRGDSRWLLVWRNGYSVQGA